MMQFITQDVPVEIEKVGTCIVSADAFPNAVFHSIKKSEKSSVCSPILHLILAFQIVAFHSTKVG
jgi:hypothetical protein